MNTQIPPKTTANNLGATFDFLMEVFEHNYILVRRLLGDLRQLSDQQHLRNDNGPDILVECTERGPYTFTLKFTHQLFAMANIQKLPVIPVRIYMDARLAEVWEHQANTTCLKDKAISCLQQRWRRNRFLLRWLTYLLQQGYQLDKINSAPAQLTPVNEAK
ncbi:MAG TPA: DUF1249 domain-containing protein [Halothiobacillus sp.]|nr:DUF1249 domain-containing protein [Halothiobacillus sp.]